MRSLLVGIILLCICQLGYTQTLIPGTIGNSQSICYNSAPERLSELTLPSGGTGPITRQWQSSADNIIWTNISRATRDNYTAPALTQSMYYRLNYTSGSETVPSAPVTITVLAEVIAGTIGSTQTICYGITPGRLSEITSPSGGTGSFTRIWQSSTDNITWTNISGATRTTYSVPALTLSLYYRLNYKSGNCIANSSPVLITVSSEVTAGNIGTAQTICYNTIPVPLNQLNSPTGGNGTYSFQWQSSTDNISWTNITGAELPTYSPSALTTTTWFRRMVTSGACLSQSTPSVLISVNTELTPGTIRSAQTICYNTIPAPIDQDNPPTGGTGTYTYQWQNSTDNIAWTNISGATLAYYSPPALTTSTWYRLLVTSGICTARSTSPVFITVNTNLTAGIIGNDQTIVSGTIPGALTETQAASGGSGSYTYQWQVSVNGTTFTNITGATSFGFTPPSLSADTWYRRQVIDAICGSSISNVVKITINPRITLYTSEVPVEPGKNYMTQFDLGTRFEVLSSGFLIKARLYTSAYEGGAHQIRIWRLNDLGTYELIAGPIAWNLSSGIQGWREIDLPDSIAVEVNRSYMISVTTGEEYFAYSADFTPISQNSHIRYLGGNLTSTIGEVPNSNIASSLDSYFRDVVFVPFSPGSAGISTTICYNTTPPVLTQITAPSGGFGGIYTYQWQNSTDGITWANIPGATSTDYSPSALIVSTYYRRVVTTDGLTGYCSPVLITVLPQIVSAQLHDNITILYNTSTNFNVAISEGTAPFIINYTINGVPQTAIGNYSSGTNIPTGILTTGVYTYALTSVTDANGCAVQSLGTNITITATENGNLTPGTIGSAQTICYNIAPAALTQITTPTGGSGVYTFQWQSSPDNTIWTDIPGATLPDYSPSVQTASTYYRRIVISGSYLPIPSAPVLITVLPQVTLAQLQDNITIENNASTNFNVAISGGTAPYIINYTINGLAQTAITNYSSGTDIPTGILTSGAYTYTLTSVTDANGCTAQNLGTNIIVTVNPITLYTTEVPVEPGKDYMTQFDLGTKFEVLSSGYITKARLYSSAFEGGAHQIRFWRLNGQGTYVLIAGPIDWSFSSGTAGWREVDLASPIAIDAGSSYMISITTGDNIFAYSSVFTPVSTNSYIRYLRSNYTNVIGNVPNSVISSDSESYFRDVAFVPFSPGSAGVSTTICYNTAPPVFEQISAPSGGFGQPYSFQWQKSTNGIAWSNITGANSPAYTPPVLTVSTYYRRVVTSGGYSVNGPTVFITVDAPFTTAQFNSSMTIYENSSTYLNIVLTGGTSPYTINYTHDITQTVLTNYTSGTGIYTGILPNGTYVYNITSVTDAYGCNPASVSGNPVTINATLTGSTTSSNKALLIVNSSVVTPDGLGWYTGFNLRIKPYFDWFGIPYDLWDIATTPTLPDFNNYALIIFGHRNVYHQDYTGEGQQEYPIDSLESAINKGVGLYSLDPHLFDFPSSFNSAGGNQEVSSGTININSDHFITQNHSDGYTNTINLKLSGDELAKITIHASSYTLTNAVTLATMSDGTNTAPLLEAATFGTGKIVKWSSYTWMMEAYLGPVYGMDDLIWRGIVWAAKKPFIMQGIPPMVTMRVDDVNGDRSQGMLNLQWLDICNAHGFIPWLGLMTNELSPSNINKLRDKINNSQATAAAHAFGYEDYIYYNVNNLAEFNSRTNVLAAWNFFSSHQIPHSNYVIPHYYLMDEQAVDALAEVGVEFIGNVISYRDYPLTVENYPGPWLNGGPYRIDRYGTGNRNQPLFYAGNVTLSGNTFFNVLTEIGDDGGYEWYPGTGTTTDVISRGVRHLRRALDGMFLPVLFTHENQMVLAANTWNQILTGVVNGVSSYNPEYRSMDYAVRYLRAKENIEISNVTDHSNFVNITCSGINEMDTRCYLFSETDGQISFRLVTLPTVTSTSNPVTIAVLK